MDGVLVQAELQREAPSLPPVRPSTPLETGISDRDFQRVQSLIRRQAGIVLSAQKRDMVSRRLGKRLRTLGLQDLGAYMDRLEGGDQAELQEFRNALTTNLTAFFREPHHFQVLKDYFASHGRGHTYRVWSAACSTGEEPYSIAMSAIEHFGSLHPPVRILATDLDTEVLAHARAGIYAEERIQSLGRERKRAFFLRGQGEFEGKVRVQAPLKSLVQFRAFNLLSEIYEIRPEVDVVFLRNVMIYFDRDAQRQILRRMRQLIRPDGLLIIGHSENLFHCSELFRSLGQTVYQPVGSG